MRQHLDIGEAYGVINDHVDIVVSGAIGVPLQAVAGDPMLHLSQPSQRLDVDVGQVTGALPFVSLHRGFRLLIPQPSETQAAESPGHNQEGPQ